MDITSCKNKDIFVSLENGDDYRSCGNLNQPCRTIDFTFTHIIENHDVIILDGGRSKALVYNVNKTINITKHFTIKKFASMYILNFKILKYTKWKKPAGPLPIINNNSILKKYQ